MKNHAKNPSATFFSSITIIFNMKFLCEFILVVGLAILILANGFCWFIESLHEADNSFRKTYIVVLSLT